MQKNGPIALAFNFLVVAFVLAPLVIVCLVAFTPDSTLTVPTTSFSLRWFRAVFDHPNFMQAFQNSLWLAFLSATIAVCLAVPAAIAITRYRFPGRDVLNGLFKSFIFALIIGVVSCHQGLITRGGPRGIGRSVTKAVVNSIVLVVSVDYLLTRILLK